MTGVHPGRCEDGEVHIWEAGLDAPEVEIERLELELNADERQRARRFVLERERRRYVAHRARLRVLLSGYLGTTPRRVRLGREAGGKPVIMGENGEGRLRFNASHSEGMALYSISRGLETGIDVERVREELARPWIAERFFEPREAARLRGLSGAEYAREFFGCWTRLEARLKALGRGFAEARARQVDHLQVWAVQDLAIDPGYAGAVAIARSGGRAV